MNTKDINSEINEQLFMNSESIIKTNNNLKKGNNENQTNDNINTYNDEKTIFSKIAEDLFVDNMDNLREKKICLA